MAPEAGDNVITGAARAGVLSTNTAINGNNTASEIKLLWYLAKQTGIFMLTSLWRREDLFQSAAGFPSLPPFTLIAFSWRRDLDYRYRRSYPGIFVDEPGVMNLIRRDVALAAESLDRFRVHFKAAACFQNAEVVIQYRHNILLIIPE